MSLDKTFEEELKRNMEKQPLELNRLSIYKSLAGFQQECPTIHKATKGYGYTYSDLPTIFKVINPILQKHSLGFTQLINNNSIKTILFHTETGETIESETEIPENVTLKGMNDFQILGSAVTYIRRYALSSMLGVVTDKDIDASGTQEPKKKVITEYSTTLTDKRFNTAINKIKECSLSIEKFRTMIKAEGLNLNETQELKLKEI